MTLSDTVLGELTYDPSLGWWARPLPWRTDGLADDATVQIIAGPDLPGRAGVVQALGSVLERLHTRAENLRREVAAQMLNLAEDWRDEDIDPQPHTLDSLTERLRLAAVELEADGPATFEVATLYYQDGDVFAGHLVVVSLDESGQITDANLAG